MSAVKPYARKPSGRRLKFREREVMRIAHASSPEWLSYREAWDRAGVLPSDLRPIVDRLVKEGLLLERQSAERYYDGSPGGTTHLEFTIAFPAGYDWYSDEAYKRLAVLPFGLGGWRI